MSTPPHPLWGPRRSGGQQLGGGGERCHVVGISRAARGGGGGAGCLSLGDADSGPGRKGGGWLTQATPQPHLAALLGCLSPQGTSCSSWCQSGACSAPRGSDQGEPSVPAAPRPLRPSHPQTAGAGPGPSGALRAASACPPSNVTAPGPAPRPGPTGPLRGQKPVGLQGSGLAARATACTGHRGEGPCLPSAQRPLLRGARKGSASLPVPLGAHAHLGYTLSR